MTKWNPRIKTRMIVLFYLILACFSLLGVRLIRVQAMDASELQKKAIGQHIGSIRVPALRGSILDTNGQMLATSVALPSVAANPREITDPSSCAYILAEALHLNPQDIYQLLIGRGTFVWVARKIPVEAAKRIDDMQLPGIFLLHEPTGRRFYPKGNLAVHVLGYTGIDDDGLEGMEGMLDSWLRGKNGSLEAEMDIDGRVIPGGWSRLEPAKAGRNLELTIDETIQYIAERELARAIEKAHAESGTVVVLDAHNGDILAIANKPDYDAVNYSQVPAESRRNRAVTDSYEPGSTFKVFIGAAALDSGKASTTQRFFCGNTITVGGWTMRNATDGEADASGSATIKEIITHSYNTGAASIGLYLGKKTVDQYLKRFGYGKITGVTLPGETEGLYTPVKDWSDSTLATVSFGQGIAVTPIQLASALQAIANKGVQMRPRLIKAILDGDGKVVKTFPPEVARRPIKPETALLMCDILRNVVTSGTGRKAEIPGYPVAGKTGTAQMVDHGVYAGGQYIASFMGFLPVQDPRIVMLVKINRPVGVYYGGSVSAPVFHNIGKDVMRHLEVPPLPITQKDLDKEAAENPPDKPDPTVVPLKTPTHPRVKT